MKLIVCALMLLPYLNAARVQLVNLLPEEAQKYIAEQALDLRYANKLGEAPLSEAIKTRSYGNPEKTYYFNGKAIENLEDYVEEEFEANQFHGQDGLGRVMYGYTDHNQAKMEARNINGEVRGSYKYMSPDGKEILVEYWADELGFHQKDNVDRSLPEAATETPEVRAARMAHEEAWNKAAEAARLNPDPDSDMYNRAANQYDDDRSQYEQTQELLGGASNQHQSLARYPSLPYANHIGPEEAGSLRDDTIVVGESRINSQSVKGKSVDSENEEVTSEPRGFFYNFDYPVQLIKENPARTLKVKREAPVSPNIQKIKRKNAAADIEPEVPVVKVEKPEIKTPVFIDDDEDDDESVEAKPASKSLAAETKPAVKAEEVKKVSVVEVEAKPEIKAVEVESKPEVKAVEKPTEEVVAKSAEPAQSTRVSLQATLEDAIPISAVHDAQVHPNQRASLVNSQVKNVLKHD